MFSVLESLVAVAINFLSVPRPPHVAEAFYEARRFSTLPSMFATQSIAEVLKIFESSEKGLSSRSVSARRADFGFNEIPEKKRSLLWLFFSQFNDVFVYILLAAFGLSIIGPLIEDPIITLKSFYEAIVILAIILLNALLGFVQEYKAEEAITLLKKLTAPAVRVRRDHKEVMIPSQELLPGDIVILETGDRAAADGRLLHVSHLEMNESSFTGESVPARKSSETLKGDPSLAEQRNMIFAGTNVTRGSGEYVVTAIAQATELGKIARLVDDTELPSTPLQLKLQRLSVDLGLIALVFSAILIFMSAMRNVPLTEALIMGISLAVSSVPEGLPAVVTACLAIGVRRMARKNVLVRRLESLETLGSVTVICTDKTGTVTENRMKVMHAWTPEQSDQAKKLLIEIAASCNRARLPDLGDPTEIGLLAYAEAHNIQRKRIDDEEVPFTSEEKYMQTKHGNHVYLKGAPEKILKLSGNADAYPAFVRQHEVFAKDGLRVLACAIKKDGAIVPIGLVAMEDPPRKGVKEAILEAKRAGIRTIMITGDHAMTAEAIAKRVGITGDILEGRDLVDMPPEELERKVRSVSVFARVSPEHKVAILTALKAQGHIVAMSGDGVNDAPALKGAHVGVAMGKNGTDVAREAASIVLTDDHYATIVKAVREGRHIYDNIRKFVLCLLQLNFYEILFFMTAIFLSLPIPYLPIHILWINLMTDGLPALALGMEPEEPNIMDRPPRAPNEHVFSGQILRLVLATLLQFGIVLTLYMWYLQSAVTFAETRTVIFTFAIFFQLFFVFTVRSSRPTWEIGFFSNPWLMGAVFVPVVLHLALLYTPLRAAFDLVPLRADQWLLVIALASSGFFFFEIGKVLSKLMRLRNYAWRRHRKN